MKTLQSKSFNYREDLQDFVNTNPEVQVVSIVRDGHFNDGFLLFYFA